MKKLLLLLLIFLQIQILFAYTESKIIDNRVNCRDYPSTIIGKVIKQLNKSDRVFIYKKLIEKDIINGEEGYWYYVGVFGTTVNGWVWGKYLDQMDLNDNIYSISIMRFVRNETAKNVLNKLLSDYKKKYFNLDILGNYSLVKSGKTNFWQAKNNGYTEYNIYKIESGEIGLFVNPQNHMFFFNTLTINENNVSELFQIGIDLITLERNLGSDYEREGDYIKYHSSEDWDGYGFSVNLKDDKVISYTFSIIWT